MVRRFYLLLFMFLFPPGQSLAETYNIGVLAFNGKPQAVQRWKPTAEYLSREINGAEFKILPLTLDDFEHVINKGEIHFVLTNPGHYVLLEVEIGVTRIVTFLSRHESRVLKHFSSVIFTRANSGFEKLEDLRGGALAAVSEQAFGGFQLAWLEFEKQGIDVFNELELKWLGFPHFDVVHAVLNGRADAGTVRAGVLEKMAELGLIDLTDIRILAQKNDGEFPYRRSSGFYPEWPLAKMPRTDTELSKTVAVALLAMKANHPAALQARGAGWTIPLNYSPVHDVLKRLQALPYPPAPMDAGHFVHEYREWIGLFVLMLLALVFAMLRLVSANRALTSARNAVQEQKLRLEDTVQERTDDLLQTNQALQIEIASHVEAEQVMHAGCRSLQSLHDIFRRNDLDRQQKLNSVVDSMRSYLGSEFAILSMFRADGFEPCSISPQNAEIVSPLSQSLSHQAIDEQQIVTRENLNEWRRYIASPVFIRGELCCLFEFASSHQYQEEGGLQRIDTELCLRILNLISQWVGNETMLLEEEKAHQDTFKRFEKLSRRETQVLELLVQGDSTKVMARKLNLSTKTVEMHRASLLRKTAAKSSTELVQLAVSANIFPAIP